MAKILHVWDIAGVAGILSKWQRRIGHDSSVIMRASFDPFEIARHYGCSLTPGGTTMFYLLAHAKAMSFRPDVIHLHEVTRAIRLWRLIRKCRMVLHEHGMWSRNTPLRERFPVYGHVDRILVAMPQMTKYGHPEPPVYVPIPVDTDLFAPRDIPKNNRGLCLMQGTQTERRTLEILAEHGYGDIDWECVVRGNKMVHDGRKNSLYRDMPDTLSRYEYYADVRVMADGSVLRDYSSTALQAMSLGVSVTGGPDFNMHDTLPDRHKPENIVANLDKEYGI